MVLYIIFGFVIIASLCAIAWAEHEMKKERHQMNYDA